MEKKNNLTELVFLLDRSGSMSGLESDTIGGFNAMLEKQRKQEHACSAQAQALDLDGTDGIADEADQKDAQQHHRGLAKADEIRNKIHDFYISLRRL